MGRDPIQEDGGINLYGFVGNEPIGRWDIFGLDDASGDPSSGFIGLADCEKAFYRRQYETPPRLASLFKAIGIHKAVFKFSAEYKECCGCCKDTREYNTSWSAEDDGVVF